LAEQALVRARADAAKRQQRSRATQPGDATGSVPAGGEVGGWKVRQAVQRVARARTTVALRQAREAARPKAAPVRNITDPQSRLLPSTKGWVQGYNAQAAATSDGIILATSVSNSPSDSAAFIPLMRAACAAAARMGAAPVGLLLADAGYLTVDNLTEPGPDRLIAIGKHRDLERATPSSTRESVATAGGGGDERIAAMRTRLATAEGIAAYRRRGVIIEPVFGHQKHNWDFTCFTGRGIGRARSEWTFHAAVHNLAKAVQRIADQPLGQPTG
jgi:hypothetical protein